MKANDNRWVPSKSKFPTPIGTLFGPPAFPGLFDYSDITPAVGKASRISGFEPFPDEAAQSNNSDAVDDESLESWKSEAEEEWQDIRNCFSILQGHFGDDFEALGPEFATPIPGPFGPVLQYRTHAIAGIWMNFYMGLIMCHRWHPSLPSAIMMAAGVAATESFATKLCHVAAGIAPDCSKMSEISLAVSSALIEPSMCLFVAGVQVSVLANSSTYCTELTITQCQDAAQRAWIIGRLRDIKRLTGWETATGIAAGCETSWIKMAEQGRGPPYTRVKDDEIVSGISNKPDQTNRVFYGSIPETIIVSRESEKVHHALGVLGISLTDETTEESNTVNMKAEAVPEKSKNKSPQGRFVSLKSSLLKLVAAAQALLLWDPEIPQGKIRVRWKCVCSPLIHHFPIPADLVDRNAATHFMTTFKRTRQGLRDASNRILRK